MTKSSRKRKAYNRIKRQHHLPIEFTLEAKADGPPRFEMVAYSGSSALNVRGFDAPVVIELASASFEKDITKINRNHDQSKEIGHSTEQRIDASGIFIAGLLSVPSGDQQEIVEAASNGFPWDASIEAVFPKPEYVPKNRKTHVNGHTFSGVYVARNAVLTGVAILNRGADRQTQVSIAASDKEINMDPKLREYIEAQGFDPELVADDEKQLAHFEAGFKGQQPVPQDSGKKWNEWMTEQRDRTAAESERIRDITRICAEHGEPEVKNDEGQMVSLAAHAIRNGMSSKEVLLEAKLFALEAKTNGYTPAIHVSHNLEEESDIIECSLLLAGAEVSEEDLTKNKFYSEKVIDAATSKKYRNYTVSRYAYDLMAAAQVYHPQGRLDNDYVDSCIKAHHKIQASGFTTLSLPKMLGNVLNKTLMAAYMRSPSFIPFVFGRVSATDFKPIKMFQVEGTGMLEELGADGQIKHGAITENEYEVQVKTYAKMLAFTRTMMINDDLNALQRVGSILGQYAFKAREYAACQVIVNSTMFSSNNGNLLLSNPLGIDGLTASGVAFDAQTDRDGLPISVEGQRVLAPASVKVVTSQLQNQTEIRNTDGTTADSPYINNPHAGSFTSFNSQWLDNALATAVGGVEDADRSGNWYVFADPAAAPAFTVAYLNGSDVPSISSSDTEFNTLGMQWRAVMDYGFGECDPKYAQKNKTAAS